MKKVLSVSIVMAILFSGCSFRLHMPDFDKKQASSEESQASSPEPDTPVPEPEAPAEMEEESSAGTPDEATRQMLDILSDLDDAQIEEIVGQYFENQTVPEAYYCVLKPILERVTYEIGSYKIDGDSAMVDVEITAVDAQTALNNIIPSALSHLAVMQLMGKDMSNPEKILAEYVAKNIEWDKLPTIKTNSTLYLVKGADGEWKVDAGNPDNIAFANAISGGAVTVAQDLKSFAERFQ